MPASGSLVGEWVVDGRTYQTTSATRFETEHGAFVNGACIKIEVQKSATSATVLKVESENDDYRCFERGVISSMGSASAASVDAAKNEVWVIGGVSYQVTDETTLDESAGPLALGKISAVDSYYRADGTLFASRISGLKLDQQIFLVLITR